MRKIFIIPAFIILVYLLEGCKKSNPTTYGQEAMIYVYKDGFNARKDSVIYSFATKPNDIMEDTVYVPLRIIGEAADRDRTVKVVAVKDSTSAVEGTHFTIQPVIVRAFEYTTNIKVLVKRSAEMKNQQLRIYLQVEESSDFKPGVPYSLSTGSTWGASLSYNIGINDFLTKPANWDLALNSFFGAYSQEKYKFIIQVTGLSEFPNSGEGAIQYGEFLFLKQKCRQALAEYEKVNGPLYDENGIRITFPN